MYISIEKAKRILNLEPDYTVDDDLIEMMIEASEASVENEIHRPLQDLVGPENALPKPLQMAILKLVQHMYDNQGIVAYTSVNEIPYSFKFLFTPYINYSWSGVTNNDEIQELTTMVDGLNKATQSLANSVNQTLDMVEAVDTKANTISDKMVSVDE